MEKIIRIGADDSNGYQIANKNSTIAYKPQGITVVTAEDIPINVASSLVWTLILEMNRKTVEVDKLTIVQNNHYIYKRFVENYIGYISETGTSCYCGTLKDRFLQERNIFQHVLNRRDISIDNRTNDACVFLYIGFDEFLKYARKVGVLDEKSIIEYADINYRIFLEIVESQAELINQKNEIYLFFHGLRYLLDTKEENIEMLKMRETKFSAVDSKTAIGFIKKGFVFIKSEYAYKKVCDYYKRYGKNFPISEEALRKQLLDLGYLNKIKGLLTTRISVNGESYACMRFEGTVFNKLLKGNESIGEDGENEISSYREAREKTNVYIG